MYSINVPRLASPAAAPTVKAGRIGPAPYRLSGFKAGTAGAVRAQLAPLTDRPNADTDTALFSGGAITVTPLRTDWTDAAALGALASWMPQPAQ